MARILGEDGHQYHPLPLDVFVEPETQRQISAKSRKIFPGFVFVLCCPLVQSEDDARRPDFVLIENDYRSWWVGEVERSHHSFAEHVMPQVETFRKGHYDESHVEAIIEKCDELDELRLRLLVLNEQPRVLVVVDKIIEQWRTSLGQMGVPIVLFEVFRSESHRYLFRVNGQCPLPLEIAESECEFPPSMPNILRVSAPAGLNLVAQKSINVHREGVTNKWSVIAVDEAIYLRCEGDHNLETTKKYNLRLMPTNTFNLEEKRK